MDENVRQRVRDFEDNFTERKLQGAAKGGALRKTLVAFANSVPEHRTAVLYIGVHDNGNIEGVSSPDSVQKTVRQEAERGCYPPIDVTMEVLRADGKPVVAVIVPCSRTRRHFAGPSYVRIGSESVMASDQQFRGLIDSRIEKARWILEWKDKPITVAALGKELGADRPLGDKWYRATHECLVLECNPQYVRLQDLSDGRCVTEPLKNVTVSRDEARERLKLDVQAG
jgi:hypothetical protein